jgi:hypothetical protein
MEILIKYNGIMTMIKDLLDGFIDKDECAIKGMITVGY